MLGHQRLGAFDAGGDDAGRGVLLEALGVEHAALAAIESFRSKVEDYKEKRDFPAIPATSRLSIYLKNGSVTIGQGTTVQVTTNNTLTRDTGSFKITKSTSNPDGATLPAAFTGTYDCGGTYAGALTWIPNPTSLSELAPSFVLQVGGLDFNTSLGIVW